VRGKDRKSADKDDLRRKDTKKSISKTRSRKRSDSGSPQRRKPAEVAKPTRVQIGQLTRNITKEHITEIFSTYGVIKHVDFPSERSHPRIGRGVAYVEYASPESAESAMKHMDGGQIDGQEITAAPVVGQSRPPMRRSPIRNNRPMQRPGWRSPLRFGGRNRQRSPIRRRSPRRGGGGGGIGGDRRRRRSKSSGNSS
jgi:RNA-binding protein with serine-rich domain 1